MSKADEAFLAWKESRKTVYDRRQYFAASDAFAAAWEARGEHDLQAVEAGKSAEWGGEGGEDYTAGYIAALEDTAERIKGDS